MNVLEGERLVAYWGQGLDKFMIKCMTKRAIPYSDRIHIHYKGYVFSKVVFYVYTINVEIIGGEIVLEVLFVSKFLRIPATLHVSREGCVLLPAYGHHVRHVPHTFLREVRMFCKKSFALAVA